MGNDQTKEENQIAKTIEDDLESNFENISEHEEPHIKKINSTIKPHNLNDINYKKNIRAYQRNEFIEKPKTGIIKKDVLEVVKKKNLINQTSLVNSDNGEKLTATKTSSKKYTGSLDINSEEKTPNFNSHLKTSKEENLHQKVERKITKKKSLFYQEEEEKKNSYKRARKRRRTISKDYRIDENMVSLVDSGCENNSGNEEQEEEDGDSEDSNKEIYGENLQSDGEDSLNIARLESFNDHKEKSNRFEKEKRRKSTKTAYKGLKEANIQSLQVFSQTHNNLVNIHPTSCLSQKRVKFYQSNQKEKPSERVKSILKKTLTKKSNNFQDFGVKKAEKVVPNSNYEGNGGKVSKFVRFGRKKYVYTYESNRAIKNGI